MCVGCWRSYMKSRGSSSLLHPSVVAPKLRAGRGAFYRSRTRRGCLSSAPEQRSVDVDQCAVLAVMVYTKKGPTGRHPIPRHPMLSG